MSINENVKMQRAYFTHTALQIVCTVFTYFYYTLSLLFLNWNYGRWSRRICRSETKMLGTFSCLKRLICFTNDSEHHYYAHSHINLVKTVGAIAVSTVGPVSYCRRIVVRINVYNDVRGCLLTVATTEKCSRPSTRQKAPLRCSLVASYLPTFTTCATRGTGSTLSLSH